jgi:hypothetical protein
MSTWQVGPHGPLVALAANLWWVDGAVPHISLRRTAVFAKRSDGSLVVHSAIALDDAGMAALAAQGPLRHVVVPNGYHRIDAPRFAARFPEAEVWSPGGSLGKVREAVPSAKSLDGFPGGDDVWFEKVDGLADRERLMFVRSADGLSLVFCDALFNVAHEGGFHGFMLRAIGSSGGPRVTNLAKFALVDDKKALAAHYRRLAALPGLVRVIPGHGDVITADCGAVLRAVADRLAPA